jgi:type II secretory pathway component PulF
MAALIFPGQLARRADFYHQLSSLTAAGVPIIQALEGVRNNPPSRSYRKPLTQIIDHLNHGSTFAEAIAALGNWMPPFDLALFSAGERSGRLDRCMALLAEYYREQAVLSKRVISEMAYPFFILHMAALLFPIGLFTGFVLQGQTSEFLFQKAKMLLPLYIVIGMSVYATQGSRSGPWRGIIERFMAIVPLLGKGRKQQALARLSIALEALISAGVSIVEAWPLAAASSGSPILQRAVARMEPEVLRGATPAEVLQRSRDFPELFRSLYSSGEISGQLDTTLKRLYTHYSTEASMRFQNFAQWLPRLIFLVVAIAIGFQVVGFYTGYFNNAMSVLDQP